jgi:hypothetical protein
MEVSSALKKTWQMKLNQSKNSIFGITAKLMNALSGPTQLESRLKEN